MRGNKQLYVLGGNLHGHSRHISLLLEDEEQGKFIEKLNEVRRSIREYLLSAVDGSRIQDSQ